VPPPGSCRLGCRNCLSMTKFAARHSLAGRSGTMCTTQIRALALPVCGSTRSGIVDQNARQKAPLFVAVELIGGSNMQREGGGNPRPGGRINVLQHQVLPGRAERGFRANLLVRFVCADCAPACLRPIIPHWARINDKI